MNGVAQGACEEAVAVESGHVGAVLLLMGAWLMVLELDFRLIGLVTKLFVCNERHWIPAFAGMTGVVEAPVTFPPSS